MWSKNHQQSLMKQMWWNTKSLYHNQVRIIWGMQVDFKVYISVTIMHQIME
jgi:hypothetical protein